MIVATKADFVSLQKELPTAGSNKPVHLVLSKQPLNQVVSLLVCLCSDLIQELFSGVMSKAEQVYNTPSPSRTSFTRTVLGANLYYANSIKSMSHSVELQLISGRNVARLCFK